MSTDLPSALEELRTNPQDPSAWKSMGLMIIAQGTPDQLSLFEHRQKLAGDAVPMLFQALFNDEFIQNPPLRQRLIQFADHATWDSPLGVVVRFFAACARLYESDGDGPENFREVGDAIARNLQHFAAVPHLVRAPQFSRLITSHGETRMLWSDWGALPPQEIIWQDELVPAPGAEPLIFAACDGGYLDRFGARFLQVVTGLGPVHIHVVNPRPGQLTEFQAKAGSAVFLSQETVSDNRRNSQYYACARFFAANAMMQRYRRDVLMLDIDLEGLANLDVIFERTSKADIAYFGMPTLMPWLRHHAAFIHLKCRLDVSTFLERFANLLSHQLPDSVWYVDQLCLASVVAAYSDIRDGLVIDPLEQADGFPFAHFVTPAGDDAEKEKLRRDVSV
ncbi:hypothetical protein EOI86_00780 [Hwanghaeella grinnelliae]|uniref:Uncharacterized protein n=1 Tax=Hwanghaeella grinnelliae TaxID=2500179 RepID=A0A3S2ZA30_9PROT|nr:hypothetical protein [Hwanghaeella grinnelliae]RVU37870.1 hypothetical protein EOI86_00780 [Hwanghaeella grinnelliae]